MRKSKVLPSLKRISNRTSQTLSVPEEMRNLLVHIHKLVALGMNPIEQLGIKWNNQQDYDEIKYILKDIIEYPSNDLADLHRDCNRLGTLDVYQNEGMFSEMLFGKNQPEIYCPCCGYLLQSQQIPVSTPLRDIGNMGLSTHLYFQNLIATSILFLVLFFVYGIFALVTNIISYDNSANKQTIPEQSNFLRISLSAKQLFQTQENNKFYFIQCWLGLCTVLIFCGIFILIKYFEKNDQILINSKTISASDFSVVIKGVPTTITKTDLQMQLDTYYEQLTEDQKPKQIDRPFKIAKMNLAIPFYLTMDQLLTYEIKSMINERKQMKDVFVGWIEQRRTSDKFSVDKTQRLKAYNKYMALQCQIDNHYKSIVDQIVIRMKQKNNQNATTSAYVTFDNSYSKQLFCHLNSPQDTIIRTKNKIGCCQSGSYFTIKHQQQSYPTTVRSAPQPEDIVWTNIGQSFCDTIKRKLLTYTITLIILGASFVIIFLLSREQLINSNDAFLSFVISVSITVINILLQVVMRVLTTIEREETQTNFQSGIALKSIFAQVLNSILIPFVVKYFLQDKNLYHVEGLAYVIFTLGITNSFILPVIKLINLDYISYLIRSWLNKQTVSRLKLNQKELNQINTLTSFQIGTEYIYPVNLYLFVCFYVTLQPVICIFGIGGLVLMYWVQKHALFKRSKRPFPGNDNINRTIYRVMYLGPVLFSLGNLMWSNIIQNGGPQNALIPNLISLGISTIFMLIPYKGFFQNIIEEKFGQEMLFENERIYLASEYDRMNPATAKEAMTEYYKFLREYKERIQNISHDQMFRISALIRDQSQKGNNESNKVLSLLTNYMMKTPILNGPILEEQSHLTFEENHIIIKEDGIEQLKVKRQRRRRNQFSYDKLLKQVLFNQQDKIELVQNWGEEKQNTQQNSFFGQLLKIEVKQNKVQRETENNIERPEMKQQVVQQKQSLKTYRKLPTLNIRKRQARNALSYDILKNIVKEYEQQIKTSIKQKKKQQKEGGEAGEGGEGGEGGERGQVKRKQKSNKVHEQSTIQLHPQLSSKEQSKLLSMIFKSGNIQPIQSNM